MNCGYYLFLTSKLPISNFSRIAESLVPEEIQRFLKFSNLSNLFPKLKKIHDVGLFWVNGCSLKAEAQAALSAPRRDLGLRGFTLAASEKRKLVLVSGTRGDATFRNVRLHAGDLPATSATPGSNSPATAASSSQFSNRVPAASPA